MLLEPTPTDTTVASPFHRSFHLVWACCRNSTYSSFELSRVRCSLGFTLTMVCLVRLLGLLAGNRVVHEFRERFRGDMAVIFIIELQYRRAIARAQAEVCYLYAHFLVCGGFTISNTELVGESLHQPVRAHHIATHAVAEEHMVMTAFFCTEVCIEGENSEHASGGGTEVLGHNFGGFRGNPAEMFVDLLTGNQDKLLCLLVIIIGDVREQLAHNVQVYILPPGIGVGHWPRCVCLIRLNHSGSPPCRAHTS